MSRRFPNSPLLVLVSLAFAGCHDGATGPTPDAIPEPPVVSEPPPPPDPAPIAEPSPAADSFEAKLTIDPKPGGKKFQGVWLRVDGRDPMVIDYRAREIWRAFEDEQVTVTGKSYHPQGQAISARHFRVETLGLVDHERAQTIAAVKQEQNLKGRFEERRGEPGSKSAGERWLVFTGDAGTFMLANSPENPPLGVDSEVRAREVQMSPFSAHRGGRYLWVLDIESVR